MFITLYFIVTRLPDSLLSVKDHFLSLDPTSLTVDLLEEHLLAAETIAVSEGAARGTPRTPFFEGCSPSPLAPSYASAATAYVPVAEDVGAASASAKRSSGNGKGGRSGGGGSRGGGGGSSGGGGGSGGGGSGGSGGRSGGSGGLGGGSGGGSGSGSSGAGGGRTGAQRWPEAAAAASERGPDMRERPRWAELLRSGVAIFDLDFDAILTAMYALSVSAEGDCYRCVPPDPSKAAAALGASESALPGTAPAEALHTFTLDSGASRCFFHDRPGRCPFLHCSPLSGGSVRLIVRSSPPLVLYELGEYCGPPGFAGHYHHSWGSACVDLHVYTNGSSPGHVHTLVRVESVHTGYRASSGSCICPGVRAGPVVPPCSFRLLSHQTLLWHHRLGHPSLPRLRGMHSRLRVSGLPRSLPPLPPSPAPPCLPCVEGQQRATPHSSFPPTTAPLQTLHMDVWGPARVSGQGRERYFRLVVDDYTRYTTVFPLRSKGEVVDVLIPWIRTVRLQLRERFRADLPALRVHSDRGGEFSSDLLQNFCCGEGILQQNGIAERRIGLVMEVARISMIHAAAPHFFWPFAVRYAAHQLNLWPCISLPETSPTLPWMGEVGDVSMFRGPALSGVSQVDPLPGTVPAEVAGDSGAARGTEYGGAESGGAEPGGAESEGAGSGGAEPGGEEPRGAEPGGAGPGGAEPEGVEPGGAESEGAESGGAGPRGATSSGGRAGASSRLSPRSEPLSPQQLREWLVRRARLRSGAAGAGAPRDTRAGGARVTAGAGGTGGTAAAGPGGACTRGTKAAVTGGVGASGAGDPTALRAAEAGAGGTGVGGTGAGGAGAVDPGARGGGAGGASGTGAGGTVRQRPYFVPLLQQGLGDPSSPSLIPPLLCPPPDQS
ncbi:unnamed protein product [Closterium sp. NIES-54]